MILSYAFANADKGYNKALDQDFFKLFKTQSDAILDRISEFAQVRLTGDSDSGAAHKVLPLRYCPTVADLITNLCVVDRSLKADLAYVVNNGEFAATEERRMQLMLIRADEKSEPDPEYFREVRDKWDRTAFPWTPWMLGIATPTTPQSSVDCLRAWLRILKHFKKEG